MKQTITLTSSLLWCCRLAVVVLLLSSALPSSAAQAKPAAEQQSYARYTVGQGENIYDVARNTGLTKDEIIRYNPWAADGISAGDTLLLPLAIGQQHQVQTGETLYGLAKRYGVTIDELIAANPGTENGVTVGQVLTIPSKTVASPQQEVVKNAFSKSHTATPSSTVAIVQGTPGDTVLHEIEDGESLYVLAKRYQTNVESILAANPGLAPADYVPHQTVMIVAHSATPFSYLRYSTRYKQYEVQRGESFASIAKDHGISEQAIKAANPNTRKAKRGKIINLPYSYYEPSTGDMATIGLDELESYYRPRIDSIYNTLFDNSNDPNLNIAIVLPFQLHKSAPPKQAYLYTDFYKGFLLALDSAANTCNKPIKLWVYDTQHNLNVTDSILALPQLRHMDVIIAPSEPKQLQRINEFGRRNHVNVLNCFTTKNQDYLTNPYTYQVNTPTHDMTAIVLKWFSRQFADYHVIYLMETEGEADKEIFDDIRNHITAQNTPSTSVNVGSEISYNSLSNIMNPGSKYVFIPSSSSKNLLKRVIKTLKQIKQERFDCEIALIGYPEYVLYLKDYQTDLQDVDTYIFSRFFNAKGYQARDIEARYKRYYQGDMLSSMPNMAIYGFDTGLYLLKTLGSGKRIGESTTSYRGVQTSFRFERANNWSGYTNQAIDIVHFSTDHKITVNVQ